MKFNKVYIEITNICGLSCTFCPTKISKPQTMSLEFFDSILSQVKNYTKIITLHIFGDPLTLSNLEDYINLIKAHNLKVEITTTGYFLTNFDANLFLNPAIRQINFSLNSYNKNEMKVSLEQFMTPILNLCELKLKNQIHNFINLRLWNLDDSNSENDFNKKVFHILENHFKIKLEDKKLEKQIRLENQILLHFDNYFSWPTLQSNILTDGYCQGLSSHFGILSNGVVVPCCLDGFGIINLGNIKDETLNNILSSEKSKRIIDDFAKNIAHEELCKKCTYKDRFQTDKQNEQKIKK